MASEEHLKILDRGVEGWNQWRKENPRVIPRLSDIKLHSIDLDGMNLRNADLRCASLRSCRFRGADLSSTNLTGSDLSYAHFGNVDLEGVRLTRSRLTEVNLEGAYLVRADLEGVNAREVNLSHSDLTDAMLTGGDFSHGTFTGATILRGNLSGASLRYCDLHSVDFTLADLSYVDFSEAKLSQSNLSKSNLGYSQFRGAGLETPVMEEAIMAWTTFADCDLRSVFGLDTIEHQGPSTIGIDTIYKSGGQVPEAFLRGCGVPEDFITFARSLIGKAIDFYSCFISYSHKDEEFAKRLVFKLRDAHIRVWYAPEEMKGGQKLHDQIDHAIQMHDRLLLVLSVNSLESEWVMTEIRRARKAETKAGRRKLFPIRLVDFETIRQWECFDADTGKDLAVEVREYFIPDFSNWKDHNSFESAANRLLNDLQAAEG